MLCCALCDFQTLAYAIPLVQQILHAQEANPDVKHALSHIVLQPTAELCEQARVTIQTLLKYCSDSVKVCALRPEARKLNLSEIRESRPNILIATPSQLLDYCVDSDPKSAEGRKLSKGAAGAGSYLSNLKSSVRHLVLDEADLVLGLGYESDLKALFVYLGHGFQISLFSATLDTAVDEIKNVYMPDAQLVTIEEDHSAAAGSGQPKLSQFYLNCSARDKYMLAYAFLQLNVIDKSRRVLFFLNNIADAYRLKLFLGHFSVAAAVLNHELPYNSRQNILEQFNRGLIDILIATDEAAGEAQLAPEDDDDANIDDEDAAVKQEQKKGKKRAAEEAVKEEDDGEEAEEEEQSKPSSKKAKTGAAAAASSSSSSSSKKQKKGGVKSEDDEAMVKEEEEEEEDQLDKDVAALAELEHANSSSVAAARTSRRYRGHNHWGRNGGAAPGGTGANVSRGVDFKDVGTVVNFDFPLSVRNYIHRIGRTARADRSGVALSFVTGDDAALLGAVLATQVERAVRGGAAVDEALPQLQALPFDPRSVEAFRYRCSDKLHAVTTLAVREERLSQIKAELVNSDKLRAHWEDNPRELNLLKHDKVLRNAKVQKHLATVPSYLLPDNMQEGAAAAAAAAAATQVSSSSSDANRNKLRRNKHKNAVTANNKAQKLQLDKMKGITLAKAKGRHTMATKNAQDPLRSFRAKPFTSAAAAGLAGAGAAAGGASKAKVDF